MNTLPSGTTLSQSVSPPVIATHSFPLPAYGYRPLRELPRLHLDVDDGLVLVVAQHGGNRDLQEIVAPAGADGRFHEHILF